MTKLTLQYREDPSTGLPRLDDPEGKLLATELDIVCRELEHQFERLASGCDNLLDLNGQSGPNLPQRFLVTVTDRSRRCPTLLLEAAPTENNEEAEQAGNDETTEDDSSPARGCWQRLFVAEVADLAASTR